MRRLATLHPQENIPAPPDTVQTLLIAGSSGQALDWATSTGAVANAATADVNIVRFSGFSTAGQTINFMVNLFSTAALVPSSGTSISSTGTNHPVMGQGTFQIPGGSTGWSVASLTSGYVIAEQWAR